MSVPRRAYAWPSRVLEWSDATGSVRLLLLVLAHYADEDGRCWPSLDTLACDLNLSRRQVIDLVKAAEAMGELIKERVGRGAGNATRYRLIVGEKVRSTAPLAAAEKVRSSARKGAVQPPQKVRPTAPERPERSEHGGSTSPRLGGAASRPQAIDQRSLRMLLEHDPDHFTPIGRARLLELAARPEYRDRMPEDRQAAWPVS